MADFTIMKNYITRPLISKPGIQRDGTPFASQSCIDGQWCRFYMGRPRSIGGYKLIDIGNNQIIRSQFAISRSSNTIDNYLGRYSSINYNTFDYNGNGSGEIDRTPIGYTPNTDNIWYMDLFATAGTTPGIVLNRSIVAAAIPNGSDISNSTPGNIYYGDTTNNSPLIQINQTDLTPLKASGGIVFSSPIMVAYGNDGLIQWSNFGDVTKWNPANNTIIDNTKVIQMYRTRGGTSPQLLAWTLGSLINLTYVPSPTANTAGTFSSSIIQDNITVMSPASIIQYNQQFFWIGIDQFYFFNGIVNRLPNTMSTDWFFQNINLQQRAKVWGMTVPRHNELWWFYPRNSEPGADDQIECNACIIYNTELNIWYDSMISRASGLSNSNFPYPLMADSELEPISSGSGIVNNYVLWMHEYGIDKEIFGKRSAINSFHESHIMTLFESDPVNNRLLRTRRIEPDFNQPSGKTMTVTVNNRMFPSDSLKNGQLIQVGPLPFTDDTQKIDTVTSQGRLVSYVFQSNEVGGSYQAGQTLIDYEIGDIKPGGNS